MHVKRDRLFIYGFFCLILMMNIGFWLQTHSWRPSWGNVPPVPSTRSAAMMTMGDAQFSYRMIGIMLQNLGAVGGQTIALREYDYSRLGEWFLVEDALDPVSNFIPALAAYYYGSSQDKADLTPVINYLEIIGQRPEPQKWRWLAHAVFLARFDQGDLARALELANTLANLPRDDMPAWARQMPAFILNAQGEKQAAYGMMMGILASGAKDMSPTEIRFIRDYVCDQILTPDQASKEELCNVVK